MKRLVIVLASSIFFYGCSAKKENELDITVQSAQSSKIDIGASTYTVYFISKEPSVINFQLSEEEKDEIVQAKKELLSNWEPVQTIIEDSCWYDPKLYTRLTINSKKGLSVIDIDGGCDNFYPGNSHYAIRVKKFIAKIYKTIKSKKEIEDAPESDIPYL
jgi:hypothetical protein